MKLSLCMVVACLLTVDFGSIGQADVINWQTGESIPGTEGIVLGPDVDLSERGSTERNLRFADFEDADLTSADFEDSWLENARFVRADLTHASLDAARLAGADFTDAVIVGAGITDTTMAAEQLYSTASYKAKNLAGVNFDDSNLAGWSFVEQDLTNADFGDAGLFGVNLTDAHITGANFHRASLTADQLYSTASYKSKNLVGIDLEDFDLSGWNFMGQNLVGADLESPQTDGTDFSFADLRGARILNEARGATKQATILPHGLIRGLVLGNDDCLVVRNHRTALSVSEEMELSEGSSIELVFSGEEWQSTIGINRTVVPTLSGTLALSFDDDTAAHQLIGVDLQLFDWNGLLAEEERFDQVAIADGHVWNLTKLYSTGSIRLLAVPEPTGFGCVFLPLLLIRSAFAANRQQ